MIRETHKSGKAVFAWTINDDYKAERLLELGVDGIITDYLHIPGNLRIRSKGTERYSA